MLDQRIRQLRQAKGISQVDLAKKIGVSKQSVCNWENGNIQPSIDILLRLAACLSVSTDCLLGLDDRQYLEVTGLTAAELAHVQQIIDDLRQR